LKREANGFLWREEEDHPTKSIKKGEMKVASRFKGGRLRNEKKKGSASGEETAYRKVGALCNPVPTVGHLHRDLVFRTRARIRKGRGQGEKGVQERKIVLPKPKEGTAA